jgi:hypothetical protein
MTIRVSSVVLERLQNSGHLFEPVLGATVCWNLTIGYLEGASVVYGVIATRPVCRGDNMRFEKYRQEGILVVSHPSQNSYSVLASAIPQMFIKKLAGRLYCCLVACAKFQMMGCLMIL